MDRRTFMKLMGGLASMPIIGRIAKPLKSETVQEGIAAVSDKGMELYEMVIAKVMKEGKKIGESGRVDSYKHPDRPDITVDVNQTDGSAEIYFDTDRGSKGYAKIDRDMETGGTDLQEAEEIYKGTPEGDYYKDIDEGISGGLENLEEFTRIKKSIGGKVKKTNTTPYDPRASIMDYGAALDKVGAGTQAQKSKSLGQYAKNYFTGLGEAGLKKLNPSVRSLAASYGIGKPISKFSELSPQVGQALQGAIMNTIKNPQQRNALTNSNISLKNIPVSSYTSYFKDRGVANTAGLYDTGYNSFADQLKDMAAALAGDASAIARTTYGRFNVDIDPEARTGFLRDTYDFSKKMPGSTAYGINMALPQKFVDEILNSAEYQKATGYKPPSQFPDYKTAALQSQFYKNNPSSLDFDLFKSAYAKATGGPKTTIGSEGQLLTNYGNYDPSRTYSSYMSNTQTSGNRPFFDQFVNDKTFNKSALLSMYGAPGYMKPYYKDGGSVDLTIITMPDISGSGVESLFKTR